MRKAYFGIVDDIVTTNDGIYILGNTTFNPNTMQHYYLIKVGMSGCGVKQRLKHYTTYNPAMWIIDTQDSFTFNNWEYTAAQMEQDLQEILQEWAEFEPQLENVVFPHATEWHCVSRDIYLIVCDYGYTAFDVWAEFGGFSNCDEWRAACEKRNLKIS